MGVGEEEDSEETVSTEDSGKRLSPEPEPEPDPRSVSGVGEVSVAEGRRVMDDVVDIDGTGVDVCRATMMKEELAVSSDPQMIALQDSVAGSVENVST